MIYLVGDVQGCDDALHRLLQVLDFSPSRDRLVLLGDLVNRGPASLAVIKRVVALGTAAGCLLGNHDLHLLAVSEGARPLHRGDTFGDVLADPQAHAWLDWLRQQPLARMEAGWLCVHAGVPPQWSTEQTLALAAEVQTLLRGSDLAHFLPQMYGNEPSRWQDTLQGHSRARFVINALTRLRFCSADGTLDFKTKEGAGAAPEGFMPWFDVPGRAAAGQAMAFGHWSTLGAINRPDLLATDTGCVWGGCLSAVRVDGGRREFVQVHCSQAQKPG
jgi:bis(5'-nucleosyl)-tetraphosphatase (symmetrical)